MSVSVRIPSLDGIRALSFLIVFIAHAGLDRIIPGGFGVTVFFFLSGYLITTLLRMEFAHNGHVNLKHFWLRRVLRILPPFYLVLMLAALLTATMNFPDARVTAPALTAQLLHFTNYWSIWHGYDGQPVGTGVYWSLAVEEHFYLLFPWLFIAMQRQRLSGRSQALLLWSLCAVELLWRCALVLHWHTPTDRTYMGSDTRMDSILFGCALAVWNNPVLDTSQPADTRVWKWLLLPGSLLLLGVCLVVRNEAFRETLRYTLQGIGLTVLFHGTIRFAQWPAFRWLGTPWLVFIGTLSYTLYLVHYTTLFTVEHLLPQAPAVLRGVLAFGISMLLAWASYVWVEKPCARLRKRLSD